MVVYCSLRRWWQGLTLVAMAGAGAVVGGILPRKSQLAQQKVQAEYETGYRYLKAGEYKKAIKSFERVLKENPSHALAYSNMGYSYRKLKQYDKAIELYGKALMLDPKLAEAHEYIGEAYLEMGKIEEAKQHLTILKNSTRNWPRSCVPRLPVTTNAPKAPSPSGRGRDGVPRVSWDTANSPVHPTPSPSGRGRAGELAQFPTAAGSATSSPQNSS